MMRLTMVGVLLSGAFVMNSAGAAEGGVSFSRNRLIFPASEKAIDIRVNNSSDGVFLVQAGVSGDPTEQTPAPFIVTPPLFRLEGQRSNEIRIIATGNHLPQDRESMFYFYGKVIPSSVDPNGMKGNAAVLSIAMRTVLKLFWRPKGLTPSPAEAPARMVFSRDAKGVRVRNPTPYYESFSEMKADGKPLVLDGVSSVVPPYGEIVFPSPVPVTKISWRVMNDFGGATNEVTQTLSAEK